LKWKVCQRFFFRGDFSDLRSVNEFADHIKADYSSIDVLINNDGIATYSQSKLFNLLFSLKVTRLLINTNITVNTVHPGYVKSSLFDKMGQPNWDGIPNAGEGARSALYAALSPHLEGVSGKYIYLEREDPGISPLAKDEKLAEILWSVSMSYISKYLNVSFQLS